MSITLNKNSSGTWGLPERVKSLKAWQRLWVVSGVTYLLLVIAAGYVIMPTRERLDRDMVFAVTEEVKKYEGLVFAGDSPDKIFALARTKGYSVWIADLRKRYRIGAEGDAGFNRIEKEYRQSVEGLTRKCLRLSAWLYVAWFVPMCVLYVMGAVVDWINRAKR